MKNAIVTGASGALGSAIAARLEREGYTVEALGRPAFDLTDAASIARSIEEARRKLGTLDLAVHAAWPKISRTKLIDTSDKDLAAQLNEGAFGSFLFLQEVAEIMKKQKKGVIVALTTSALNEENPGAMGGYLPAKAALRAMIKTFARELEPHGIAVLEYAPPFVPAGMNKDLPPRLFEMMAERQGSLASPESVAEEVVRLITRNSTKGR